VLVLDVLVACRDDRAVARLLVIPIALIALLAGVFAWSGGGIHKPADFSFINRGDIGTLDPNRMSWMQDIRVGYMVWEGLYLLDPVMLVTVPAAAETIDISDNKTVYTFRLRKDGKWSDGSGVTAQDFIFAWRRMLEEPGDYTYLFHYIKGAKDYEDNFAANKPAVFASVGIVAIDPLTLRVTLNHPVTFFPDLCAFPPFFPLNQRSMEKFARTDEKTGRITYNKSFTRPPNLVGNHAYTLVSVSNSTGQTLYTVRNPWGFGGTSIEDANGYATLTFAQMQANFTLGVMAL